MTCLSESDFREALNVLRAAGEVDEPHAFALPVLQALRELVPCDVVTFHERSAYPDRILAYAGEPLGAVTPAIREAHKELKHEDPLQAAPGVQTLSDLVRPKEFRRTDLYAYVHRPLGIEYLLQLYLEPDRTDARLEFDRSAHDFDERDRRVLTLLLPNLRQLERRTRRRAGGRADVLTPREREVLVHVADGHRNDEIGRRLGISSQTVRKHLENAFEKLGVHTRTAAVAAAFGRAPSSGESPDWPVPPESGS